MFGTLTQRALAARTLRLRAAAIPPLYLRYISAISPRFYASELRAHALSPMSRCQLSLSKGRPLSRGELTLSKGLCLSLAAPRRQVKGALSQLSKGRPLSAPFAISQELAVGDLSQLLSECASFVNTVRLVAARALTHHSRVPPRPHWRPGRSRVARVWCTSRPVPLTLRLSPRASRPVPLTPFLSPSARHAVPPPPPQRGRVRVRGRGRAKG